MPPLVALVPQVYTLLRTLAFSWCMLSIPNGLTVHHEYTLLLRKPYLADASIVEHVT